MSRYFIEGTGKTPMIDFDSISGDLILAGRSIPENTAMCYEPVYSWVIEYIKSPSKITNFRLQLEYFNVASLKWIVKILLLLSHIDKSGSSVIIHMYFDLPDYESLDSTDLREIIGSVFKSAPVLKTRIEIVSCCVDKNGKISDKNSLTVRSLRL